MNFYATERFKRAYKSLTKGPKQQAKEALKKIASDLPADL